MNYPTTNPLDLMMNEFLSIGESSHVAQQAYEFHDIGLPPNLASHTQPYSAQLETEPSYDPQALDQFPESHNQADFDVGLADDVQTSRATSMGPPARSRKRKAPTLRAEDWEPYKVRILELHVTQGLPLPEVKRTMEEELGFAAELRQYRTRISQWGKDKNVKPKEMKAIVRKRQTRKLVEVDKGDLIFEVRGNQVELGKIDRWMKRNKIPESLLYAPSSTASTPSDVHCRTISERGSPASSPAISSPALSISSIVRSQNNTFSGKSPAPIYRILPSFTPGFVLALGLQEDRLDTVTGPFQYRYRQLEEQSLQEQLYQEETSFGPDHPRVLDILFQLGVVLRTQGRYKSAWEVVCRVVEGRQSMGANGHLHLLHALNLLAHILGRQGLYVKAEKLFQHVFDSRKCELGYMHQDTIYTLAGLMRTYRFQGLLAEAETLGTHALELALRLHGVEHPQTGEVAGDLSLILQQKGEYTRAEELGVQSVDFRKKFFGTTHPATLRDVAHLAEIYISQSRFQIAEGLALQVMESQNELLGEEHPDTNLSRTVLARLYDAWGQWSEAERLQLQALNIDRRLLGAEHPDTLQSMSILAPIYRSQGRNQEAMVLMETCYEKSDLSLGSDHPTTNRSPYFLEKWRKEDN